MLSASGAKIMTDKHKTIIRKNLPVLAGHFTGVEPLLNRLQAGDILTDADVENVQTKRTSETQAGALFRLLMKKVDRACSIVGRFCKETGQSHLAPLFLSDGEITSDIMIMRLLVRTPLWSYCTIVWPFHSSTI